MKDVLYEVRCLKYTVSNTSYNTSFIVSSLTNAFYTAVTGKALTYLPKDFLHDVDLVKSKW